MFDGRTKISCDFCVTQTCFYGYCGTEFGADALAYASFYTVSSFFIIHSVTTGKTIFHCFTFHLSTFCCIRRHLCRKTFALLSRCLLTIKRKHSISSFRRFYHRHVLGTFNQIMCVYLCLLRRNEKNFYHTKPPWKLCLLLTGGDFLFGSRVVTQKTMKRTRFK